MKVKSMMMKFTKKEKSFQGFMLFKSTSTNVLIHVLNLEKMSFLSSFIVIGFSRHQNNINKTDADAFSPSNDFLLLSFAGF